VKLSQTPFVDPSATVVDAALGRFTEVGAGTRIVSSTLGDYSYITENGDILFATIGKFCSLASGVRINPPNHPTERASQHHFTYRCADYFANARDDESVFAWRRSQWVTVGHDVWIGHGATVMPRVTIGHGAVIGAGSVVTKDVGCYTVVAGVPARVIRRRFEEDVAERLIALAWWDWPHERLHAALEDFQRLPVDAFLKRHGG